MNLESRKAVMNKIIILLFVSMFGIFGCSSVQSPISIEEIIEIDTSELNKYWFYDLSKSKSFSKRPTWLPKGAGKVFYFVTIDSNGTEVSREFINSIPEGWMTQKLLDDMPKHHFKPSATNPNHIPVKVKVSTGVKG
jgi:hypothetical protein